jgi:hypothetical protein
MIASNEAGRELSSSRAQWNATLRDYHTQARRFKR